MTYMPKEESSKGMFEYSFDIGAYDTSRPLVLDPAVLIYCGYIGGTGDDAGYGIAVDATGCAYVTGYAQSSQGSFPVTVGPNLTFNGDHDAFVAKVKADGTGLLYCGYIGGTNDDYGRGIAVDEAGNAYIVGSAFSTQVSFPVLVGPDLTQNNVHNFDAFVAKLNAAGTDLLYCGYIGGAGADSGSEIAVDEAGNAYVTGFTSSTEASFPVTVGPDLSHNDTNSGYDAFVAKVNTSGNGLVYCGYIGGTWDDYGRGIAVDEAGNAYVTGGTESTEASFPVVIGPDLTYNGGGFDAGDAFVAKISPGPTYTY